MRRRPNQAERKILESILRSKHPEMLKMAQRAWCVLEPTLSSKDLSSTGLSEERILEIRGAFDEMGMLGLVDAPRTGRPAKSASKISDSTYPQEEQNPYAGLEAKAPHTKWRHARLEGKTLNRSRMATALVYTGHTDALAVTGLWIGANFRMIALTNVPSPCLAKGIWYHPLKSALHMATELHGSKRFRERHVELSNAVVGHLHNPTSGTVRGEREKLEFWCKSLAERAHRTELSLFVQAENETAELMQLLRALRKRRLWSRPEGHLFSVQFVDQDTWDSATEKAIRSRIKRYPASGQSSFAWFARELSPIAEADEER